jgi:uncharacterized membrane protein
MEGVVSNRFFEVRFATSFFIIMKFYPNIRKEVAVGMNIFIIMKFLLNTWPMMAEEKENFIIVNVAGGTNGISWISNSVAKAGAQAHPTRVG